jgi:hypothetical protein
VLIFTHSCLWRREGKKREEEEKEEQGREVLTLL